MKFYDVDWADSEIDQIQIEYDRLVLKVWNDTLQKELFMICTGLAGISHLLIWDDTSIYGASLYPVVDESEEFVQTLYNVYDRDFDYCGRSLKNGLLELKIELSNQTSFSIYCQKVEIVESLPTL